MIENILLATAYLPPIEYFTFLMSDEIWLEKCEKYQKQSYRNRTRILTANGPQALSIPVVHAVTPDGKMPLVCEMSIDNRTPWQRNHWRTLVSAYGGSPYFLYYQDALQPFYESEFDNLFDYNLLLIKTILKLIKSEVPIHATSDFAPIAEHDLRTEIHPKKAASDAYSLKLKQPYYQVFEDRFGFVPNLSILDLLFNLGPETNSYLKTNLEYYINQLEWIK